MEEQNKGNNEEEWWECAWVKILILIVICVMPIIINWFTTFENSSHDYDTPSPWTEIWSVYGGALVSAGIALVILYKQQKQNEKQNEYNRNLQIKALMYQQKYNWYFELKHALSDLIIACDANILQNILIDVIYYYELTNVVEIDKAKSKILESKYNCFSKIKSRYLSYFCLMNNEEFEELEENTKKIDEKVSCYLGVLNRISTIIISFDNPAVNKMSENEIKERLETVLKYEEKRFEKLNKKGKLVHTTKLKEYFEKYDYDFYGNTMEILSSIYKDYENELDSMGDIASDILQLEREKIDKLLDEEEIKKNLNAN